MKKIVLYLILLLPFSLFAQVNDDFEDGNLDGWTEDVVGHWEATSVNPIDGTYSLHHANNETITGYYHDQISIPFGTFDINSETTIWRFQVRYEYNPSADNTWGFFLFADTDASEMYPASNVINGYVIGVNYTNSDDLIKIWSVTSGVESIVINTNYDWQTNITTAGTAGFEITRTALGDWTIYIDSDGGFDNLVQIGTTENNIDHTVTDYIGISHEYTSSADQLIWFDDIYMGSVIVDTNPPVITSITALSNTTIQVNFNENLDETTAEMLVNYSVDNGIGNPNSAILNPADNKQVTLTFSTPFVDHLQYTLTVFDVEDLNGNPCNNETESFSYYQIAAISAVPSSSTSLDVFFNKPVEVISAEDEFNYSVNGGIGNPQSAIIDGLNDQLVHLTFSTAFQLNQSYTLTVSNVEDGFGNSIVTTDLDFTFYEAQPFDLVINEIMCDVNPAPVALPVYEYIEIFNTSETEINLSNWTLTIGTASDKIFPSVNIPSGGYAIICKSGAETSFEPYGIAIPILVETDLTTTGKRLVIKNETGTIIEDLTYSGDWYDDPEKDDGGWSMERIDPLNFCGEDDNWTVTADYTGGTPGRLNSVFASNPDNTAPTVLDLEYVSSKHIKVHFSEKADLLQAENEINYTLNSILNPISSLINPESTSIIDLIFSDNFEIGTNTIEIQNIEDNCGNVMSLYTGSFEYQLIYPITVEVMSNTQLRIHFSEKPESLSAQTTLNYSVNNGIGSPEIAIYSNTDSTLINLLFGSSFTLEQMYTLSIQDVKDINENLMNPSELEFVYYIPKTFDIVINEIMADINPEPMGVPAARYIELYNTSPYNIDLTDWIFVAEGQSNRLFPYFTLKSSAYVILCESDQEGLFSSFGDALPVLTSSDITVSGKNLKLLKPDGTIIEELDYSDEWYDDENKDDGGWSLERIDPTNFCDENNNWTASMSSLGGTPGSENSVKDNNSDNASPELLEVQIVSSNYLILVFNENISYTSGSDTLNFSINAGIGYPSLAYTDPENRTLVHLTFSSQFEDQQLYRLLIENISDNCGNQIQSTGFDFTYYMIHPTFLFVTDKNNLKLLFSETVNIETANNISNYVCNMEIGHPDFAIRGIGDTTEVFLHFQNAFPDGEEVTLEITNIEDINGNVMRPAEFKFMFYIPKAGDLIINEVLYDPYPDGADFVEIYNTSAFPIDLSRIQLATTDEDDSIVSPGVLYTDNFYIQPQSYMAFTSSKSGVIQFYLSPNEENIIEVNDFPSYVNELGTVVLLYNSSDVLDRFTYNDDMQFKLLDDPEGVSLERVNPNKPTQDLSNWHSASEYAGFATPAYQNSQYSEGTPIGDEHLSITPHVFSPDNDGYDDYANINYKFDYPGFVATVYIFDAKGRIVVQLADNMLLSTEGTMVWDGFYTDDRLAAPGTYLVFFKVYDINGNVNIYKETVVLAKKR